MSRSTFPRTGDDEDLAALRELARSFCERELAPHQLRWADEHRVDRGLWTTAGEIGLLGMGIPERYGGGGGTFAHEAVLVEEQARVGDTAWGLSAHLVAAQYLVTAGTEEQKRAWLPRLASGELVAAIAITEPGAGSDLGGIASRAVREGAQYRLAGSKTFVTNGLHAGLVLLLVLAGPDRQPSLLVLETDRTPGFRRGPALDKVGMRGQDTAELFLDGAVVPAGNLLGGREGLAMAQLAPMMNRERLFIAVAAVAAMEAALAQTVDYTRHRTAFGRKLIRFQNTRFTLAECAAEAAASRALLDRSVQRYLAGELDTAGAATVKLWTTERLCRVVDACMQLFGGYGYTTEYPIARAWADARVRRIFGGTSEIMKHIIAGGL
ncbi:acyl-CoA dehydrogenase family protein [Kutzneria buriramensis]|uniref:Acyl-[acyl-carrier-protein] dehydrogenase MbtN n=1 Tax=Kutzneria buriramensis TaxID=1045776 RepID=A0A3E0HQE1_9PSEU|nr:acyl-CoA dehydrogenase family protein [Kutzneria buriramensis]REH48480.1 acyl-CoA dehydrogenase [Kutzneria buriramensis]